MDAQPLTTAKAEEADAPDPLDTAQAVFMNAFEEEGDVVSFRVLASMLKAGELSGDSKVFVPPTTKVEAKLVSDLVDMDSVAEMEDDDIADLASNLREQLLNPEIAVDMSGDKGRDLKLTQDAIDLACGMLQHQPAS